MTLQKISQASIIFIGLILFFVLLNVFQSFLRPFVIALILTFLFVPLTRLSNEKKRTIWLTTAGIIAGLFLIIVVLSALFADSAQAENQNPKIEPSIIKAFPTKVITFGDAEIDLKTLIDPKEISKTIGNIVSKVLGSLGSFFSGALLSLLFLFFLLPSHDRTIEKISVNLEKKSKRRFCQALTKIEQSIRDYLTVKVIISLATALSSAIIMVLFKIEYVVLFTLLIFILNFIPSIGSIVAVAIVLTITLLTTPFTGWFFVLAGLLVVVQIIFGNIVEPQIAGQKLELSPVIILLSLFFWGSVWGIAGMFFAVPLTSIIKIILQHIPSTRKFVNFLN